MVGCVTPRYSSTKLNRRVVLTKQTRRNIVCAHVKVPADLFQDRPQGPDGKDFVYRDTSKLLAAHKLMVMLIKLRDGWLRLQFSASRVIARPMRCCTWSRAAFLRCRSEEHTSELQPLRHL